MKKSKQERLESAGWRVANAASFLGMSEAEDRYVRLKIALARSLAEVRKARGQTQVQVAKLLGSSQSRVAKMEAGDPSVSLDLLVRSLLALGKTPEQLAKVIAASPSSKERAA